MKSYILPKDTTIEAMSIRFNILKKLGITGRVKMVIDLSDGLRSIIEAGVRHRHPEYGDELVKLAVLRIMLGEDLFSQLKPDAKIKL